MEKIIMKSFLYTIAVLFGVITVAKATEQKAADEAIVEEVSAPVEAPAEEVKQEETK
jgi:hypothetical protein